IENILYKCPECNHEFNMQGTGATIKCGHCNFEWELTEDGFLKGITRESKFTFPDEWLKWERCECIKELESGNYNYSDTVQGFSAPNTRKLVRLERMHVTHTVNGLTIDGKYRGQDFHYYFKPTHSYNIQTELKCPNFPGKPTILGTNTSDDTLYFVPSMPGMAYKINTAWKELFRMKGINTAGQTPH
ncbi:MAG: hypothetical protein FWF29_01600, partial [Treponema sp.]|nr:hypothetical protein [Treponema sp.]